MSFTFRPHALLPLLIVAATVPWLSGCDDISCVYTTGCVGSDGGGSEGSLGATASLPENGLWIADSRPTITSIIPNGVDQPQMSPVVVLFSESMNAATVEGVIEIVPEVGGLPGVPLVGLPQTLTGDGRMLVILPPQLAEGNYTVQVAEGSQATDITGQTLDSDQAVALAEFSVALGEVGDTPNLLATWPPDNAQNQSDTSEIVAIFDRPVSPATVTTESFRVLVDGTGPVDDPEPQPLTVDLAGNPTPDPRGFTYRSVDATGAFAPLGSAVNVEITLSEDPFRITDTGGTPLDTEVFDFNTAPFASPLSASLLSTPTSAIGVPNLTAGDPEELLIQVDLADAEPGDRLDLFLFGTAKSGTPPQLIAFQREISLSGSAPVMTGQFSLSEIDILSSSSPTSTRVADGTVSFAFRLRRSGSLVSTLRVLDVESTVPGIQDVELDTEGPTITELLVPGGSTDLFISDQRGVTLVGLANESVSAVEVTTALGDNGVRPPVVGSSDGGLFVAAPVLPDIIPGGVVDYTLVAYDAAFNPSPPVTGTFEQRGVVQAGGFTPGDQVTVEVYDAMTLEPIPAALVMLHADMGDGVNFPLSQAGMTLPDGTIQLPSAGAPAVGAILTVDVPFYDLFTFHGITSTNISVPVMPIGAAATALAGGIASSTDPVTALFLPSLTSKLSDTRRQLVEPRTYDAQLCSGTTLLLCPYGPVPVREGRLGVQSFLAGNFLLTEAGFNPVQLLQAFCMSIPVPPAVSGGQPQNTSFQLPFMLIDPGIAPEEVPIELFQGTAVTFRANATSEIDLFDLVGDPTTTGTPRITVESIVPGVPGTVVVGMGLAFDQGTGDRWTVRAAAPGAVTPGGFFGMSGSVDTDLFLRCELRDGTGRIAGARVREQDLPSLPMPNEIFATSPSVLLSPPDGGNSGGASYNVDFQDVIPDLAGEPGLYQVELIDDNVRRWTVWTPDPPGSGTVSVHLPDIGAAGGMPLSDGVIDCEIAAFAWPTLDLEEFLWSDVEREHDLFSYSRMFTFDQP